MAAEDDMTPGISACSVEVSPSEVDAGADMTLEFTMTCTPAADLRGRTLLIKDQNDALVWSSELTELDGKNHAASECVLKAPLRPGAYTWLAVCPAAAEPIGSEEETSAPFSFIVKPHRTRVVVWDAPSAIECGEKFSIKVGVKCSSECPAEGWTVEVLDHDGKKQATASLSDAPWPGTAALYYAEMDLKAPDTEGLYAWPVKGPGDGPAILHTECSVEFGVRVVPKPECLLTVLAIDVESQTPVEGARVVIHPYRTFTDARGVAEVRVPKGEYRLFVSGGNYFPFRSDGEVKTDMTIRAELAVDQGLSDADVWS